MSDHRNDSLATPIAFILFNRPDETRQSFAQIAKAKPSQLFLIADGPRLNHPTDAANCVAARAVVEEIDWDCEVHCNYSETNLGCKLRVSSGLDWVFSQVEEAIILEDDIVVGEDFFGFIEEMLVLYRHDTRVMHIGGYNQLPPDSSYPYSYYFVNWAFVWGWATWRRAWQANDVKLSLWSPDLRVQLARNKAVTSSILERLESTYLGKVDSWAYGWLYSVLINSGLSVVPKTSLIQNIGFGPNATHTTRKTPAAVNKPISSMPFPIVHPPYMMIDRGFEAALAAKNRPKRKDMLRARLKQFIKRYV